MRASDAALRTPPPSARGACALRFLREIRPSAPAQAHVTPGVDQHRRPRSGRIIGRVKKGRAKRRRGGRFQNDLRHKDKCTQWKRARERAPTRRQTPQAETRAATYKLTWPSLAPVPCRCGSQYSSTRHKCRGNSLCTSHFWFANTIIGTGEPSKSVLISYRENPPPPPASHVPLIRTQFIRTGSSKTQSFPPPKSARNVGISRYP